MCCRRPAQQVVHMFSDRTLGGVSGSWGFIKYLGNAAQRSAGQHMHVG